MTAEEAPRRPLRAVQRDAARGRLIQEAVTLFARDGYEATTVEDIAAAAGVSPRTFFRYFGSKDGVILTKFDDTGDRLAAALRARPADEDTWLSLRRMFDYFVEYTEDPELMRASEAINTLVAQHEGLRSGYLERMARMQVLATEALRERTGLDELAARALVSAAFACLTLAGDASAEAGMSFGEALDAAMDAVRSHV